MREKQRQIIDYFKNPDDLNAPFKYVHDTERSLYLVKVIKRLFPNKGMRILELGSGTGRNLFYLQEAGYNSLHGVEVSPAYLGAMRENFPELRAEIHEGLIEDQADFIQGFGLIYTMAILEHIPLSPIFDIIPKGTEFLLTIEDEVCEGPRHYPRRYDKVFESRGMVQLRAWKFPPLGMNFVMRLFRRRKNNE